ncbi:MAG: hypothetical protein ACREOU_07305 [Candidatus Eiseniibacteriota bacterium]
MIRRGLVLAALLVPALAAGPLPAAERAPAWQPPAPGVRDVAIVITPPQIVYLLPHRFVLAGTDTARVRGRPLVRGRDYFLDSVAGEFRLNTTLAAGDTVRLVYRSLLAPLPTTLSRRDETPRPGKPDSSAVAGHGAGADGQGNADDVLGPVRPGAAGVASLGTIGTVGSTGSKTAAGAGSDLSLIGNKTVAVDFGSTRDVALRQSLDLNVSGRLAPGVDLIGVLSDRNTPISVEGGTRELRELDRVLLEVRSQNAGGVLGDYTLAQTRGEFARLTRELTGVEARGGAGGIGGRAALASVKGSFVSRQFQGVEGLQGPYLLPDEAGRTGIQIVAGSEEVWLDGEKLIRGESADYSMDYERGAITFTSRRLVSAASRIAVDYQIALTDYRRTLSVLSGEVTRKRGLLYGSFVREADAKNKPLSFALTEEDRFVLENSDPSSGPALVGGVSPGPGDYDGVNDSVGVTHFAFAGVDSGDFKVQFAAVGAGRGEYAESTRVAGRAIYAFVGAGLGSFTPGRLVPLPTSNDVVNGGFVLDPVSWAKVEGEIASSGFAANTFSSGGDAGGTAGRASVRIERPVQAFGRSLGVFGATAGFRRVASEYRPPGRIDAVFYEEEWGVNANRALTGQDRKGGSLSWAPVPALAFGGEYAELEADSGFFARRRSANARLAGPLSLVGRFDRVDNRQPSTIYRSEGYRNKLLSTASYSGLSFVRLEAGADFETRVPPAASDSAAVQYGQVTGGVAVPRLGPIDLTAGAGLRDDNALTGEDWNPNTRATFGRVSGNGRFGDLVSAALGLERRVRTPRADTAPARLVSDIGYTRFRQSFGAQRGEHEVSFEWTGEAEEVRLREVRFAGPGGGAFDSLGNFVGRGDYEVVIVSTGTFDRLTRTSSLYRLELRPGTWFPDTSGWGGRLADARASLLVQASLGRRAPFSIPDLLYTPKKILSRDDVSLGTYLIRPELSFGTRTRFASFLFRVERRSSADRQFEGSTLTRDEWIEEGRWRTRPDERWLSEVVLRFGQGRSDQASAGFPALTRTLDAQQLSGEATYLPNPLWRLGAVASLDRADADEDAQAPSRVVRIGPRVVYTQGGRYRAELLLRRATISGGAIPTLVPTGFPVFPDDWDYLLEASVRVRERANLVLSGNGRKPQDRSWVHSGRCELRAYF